MKKYKLFFFIIIIVLLNTKTYPQNIEEKIRNNPRKAMLYALGAGFVASLLLRR